MGSVYLLVGGQTCYSCGGYGHMSRDCTQGQVGGQTCYSCGGYGHMSRDCTQGQKCYNI